MVGLSRSLTLTPWPPSRTRASGTAGGEPPFCRVGPRDVGWPGVGAVSDAPVIASDRADRAVHSDRQQRLGGVRGRSAVPAHLRAQPGADGARRGRGSRGPGRPHPPVVCAGMSEEGLRFTVAHCDFGFVGTPWPTPTSSSRRSCLAWRVPACATRRTGDARRSWRWWAIPGRGRGPWRPLARPPCPGGAQGRPGFESGGAPRVVDERMSREQR